MAAPAALSRTLALIEPGIRSTTPFTVVGVVTPSPDGLLRYDVRGDPMFSAIFVRPEYMPDFLRPPIDAPRQGDPTTAIVPAGSPIPRFASVFDLRNYCAVPLAIEGGGLMFATSVDAMPAAAEHVEALRACAREFSQRIAEEEPLDEQERRLTRLDALAEMLPVVGAVLDVRSIFDHLSVIARRVLPHDMALVGLHMDEGRTVRIHALSSPPGVTLPEVADNPYPEAFNDGWEHAVYHNLLDHPLERDRPVARFGMLSGLRVPIRFDGRVAGVLNLSARQQRQFTVADVPIAQRLADTITLTLSHQRLAERAQEAERLRERTANHEMLEQLLDTLAGVLDIREVFDRVSAISRKVLPHDAMSVPIILDDPPRMRVHALSGFDALPKSFEVPMPEPRLLTEPWDHLLMDYADDPTYAASPTLQAGMKSVLCLPVRLEGRLHASVNFYSRSKGAFGADDVPIARRIADHVALAFSHQRIVEEARRNEELRAATASLEILDELLAVETHAGDLDDVFDRVSAIAHKVLPHDTMLLPVGLPDGKHARIYARGGPDAAAFPEV